MRSVFDTNDGTRLFWQLVIVLIFALALMAAIVLPLEPVVANEDIEACDPVGKAGEIILYRCLDDELGNVCYVNAQAAGVLDCKEQ